MARTRLTIKATGINGITDDDFTPLLLDGEDNAWELETHAYGQPDVFSFVLLSELRNTVGNGPLNLVPLLSNKDVILDLIDDIERYNEFGVREPPKVLRRLFGGVITEIQTTRIGFALYYSVKALGWIHLLENVLVSTSFVGNTSDREVITGRSDPALNGIFGLLESADNSLSVDSDLRADIKCLVQRVGDTVPVPILVREAANVAPTAHVSLGEYNQDVYLRLDLDNVKEALDKTASLSDAEWRIDSDKVLWFLAPDVDSLDSDLRVLGDGSSEAGDAVLVSYRFSLGGPRIWNRTPVLATPIGTRDVPTPLAHESNAALLNTYFKRDGTTGDYFIEFEVNGPILSHVQDYQSYGLEFQLVDVVDDRDDPDQVVRIPLGHSFKGASYVSTHYTLQVWLSDSLVRAIDTRASQNLIVRFIRYAIHFSEPKHSIDLSKLKNFVQVFGGPRLDVHVDRYRLNNVPRVGGTYTVSQSRSYDSDGASGQPSVFVADFRSWTAEELRTAGDDPSDTRAIRYTVYGLSDTPTGDEYVVYNSSSGTLLIRTAQPVTATKALWVVAPSTDSVRGSAFDEDSIREHGQRAWVIRDNTINSESSANRRAAAELRRFTSDIEKLTLVTTQDGFVVGTNVNVLSAAYSLDVELTSVAEPPRLWYIESIVTSGLYGHLRTYGLSMRRIGNRQTGTSAQQQSPPPSPGDYFSFDQYNSNALDFAQVDLVVLHGTSADAVLMPVTTPISALRTYIVSLSTSLQPGDSLSLEINAGYEIVSAHYETSDGWSPIVLGTRQDVPSRASALYECTPLAESASSIRITHRRYIQHWYVCRNVTRSAWTDLVRVVGVDSPIVDDFHEDTVDDTWYCEYSISAGYRISLVEAYTKESRSWQRVPIESRRSEPGYNTVVTGVLPSGTKQLRRFFDAE